MDEMKAPEQRDTPVTLTYTNWRGETSERTISPRRMWFGSTEWHPEPQWLLSAIDTEKGALRDFALKDFGQPASTVAALTAERDAIASRLPALRRAIDEELTKHVEHYRARAAMGGPGCGTDERMSSAADCARREVLKIIDQAAGPAPEPAIWRDPNEAPYDTPVRVRVGGMTFGAILRCDASLDEGEHPCDQWQAAVEGEHPPCWSDGACWSSNDEGMPSRQPEAWQAIEQAASAPTAHSWKEVCREKNGPEICEEPCLRCASPVAAEGAAS